MARTISPSKTLELGHQTGNGTETITQSISVDRAKVKRYWFDDTATKILATVELYQDADNTIKFYAHVARDLTTLDFSTVKSEWNTYNDPTTWSDSITMQDVMHSLIHEQLNSDISNSSLKSAHGAVTLNSIS